MGLNTGDLIHRIMINESEQSSSYAWILLRRGWVLVGWKVGSGSGKVIDYLSRESGQEEKASLLDNRSSSS